ncbi:MAG: DNA-binding protein [Candidatus Methanoperedens sp.]|nr:DNA-binding protein [Candidatus Methanoperedens sp.]
MEKIADREVAWRVFAHEFNRSNLYISEGSERAPNYIVTPTGVKCNRLFIMGVVTEVENISHDNNLWKARIADPTGVFTLYAGQYQPEAAIFLSGLKVPSYVAVVGKARKYEPEEGSVYVSIRPEEINVTDEMQRDRWVLDTAERTLERIEIIEDALSSGVSGNDLKDFLRKKNINSVLADGAVLAVAHYRNMDKILDELKGAIIHAVRTISSEIRTPAGIHEPQRDEQNIEEKKTPVVLKPEPEEKEIETEPKEMLAAIIDRLDTGKGTSYAAILEAALSAGVDGESVESGIKELMAEGRCYEPKIGVLRKV